MITEHNDFPTTLRSNFDGSNTLYNLTAESQTQCVHCNNNIIVIILVVDRIRTRRRNS